MALDFRNAVVGAKDVANIRITGKTTVRKILLPFFTRTACARWAAARILHELAYPLSSISIPVNRKHFRIQPGDAFVLNYPHYDIDNVVFRAISIQEANLESEKIIINAIEDILYIGEPPIPPLQGSPGQGTGYVAQLLPFDLAEIKIVNLPYILTGMASCLIPVINKKTGFELGYIVYGSTDGVSYAQIGTGSKFSVFGTIQNDYPADTVRIDDEVGLTVSIPNRADLLQTRSRADMIVGKNACQIGSEIISFETITPLGGDIYALSGISRGLLDTIPENHLAGCDFWYFGHAHLDIIQSQSLALGSTMAFKFLPYAANDIGKIEDANWIWHTIEDRSLCPYRPSNLIANETWKNATYTDDITLSWRPRVRGMGAGWGNEGTVLDAIPVWEGLFEMEIWADGVFVRLVIDINDTELTYTEAQNLADNTILASEIIFKVRNYFDANHKSAFTEVTVTKEA